MTDYTDLIERLYGRGSRPPCDEDRIEAADALAALVKERDDCIADRTKLRTLLDCKREDVEVLQARVKRLEDALRELVDDVKTRTFRDWILADAEAALAEGDKP